MRTFFTYLTFFILLTLCYLERENAQASRALIRAKTGHPDLLRDVGPGWTGQTRFVFTASYPNFDAYGRQAGDALGVRQSKKRDLSAY